MKKLILLALILIIFVLGAYFTYPLYLKRDNNLSLTLDQLVNKQRELDSINKSPGNEKINPNFYPQTLGIDSRNGKKIKIGYSCSDICPNYGHIYMYYDEIKTESECNKIGGKKIDAGFWGPNEFVACAPNIN